MTIAQVKVALNKFELDSKNWDNQDYKAFVTFYQKYNDVGIAYEIVDYENYACVNGKYVED